MAGGGFIGGGGSVTGEFVVRGGANSGWSFTDNVSGFIRFRFPPQAVSAGPRTVLVPARRGVRTRIDWPVRGPRRRARSRRRRRRRYR